MGKGTYGSKVGRPPKKKKKVKKGGKKCRKVLESVGFMAVKELLAK